MNVGHYRVRHPIDAVQVTADNLAEVAAWCGGHDVSALAWDYGAGAYWRPSRAGWYFVPPREPGVVFDTPRGDGFAPVGDWVIKGVKGVFFPCTAAAFADTYEVDAETT